MRNGFLAALCAVLPALASAQTTTGLPALREEVVAEANRAKAAEAALASRIASTAGGGSGAVYVVDATGAVLGRHVAVNIKFQVCTGPVQWLSNGNVYTLPGVYGVRGISLYYTEPGCAGQAYLTDCTDGVANMVFPIGSRGFGVVGPAVAIDVKSYGSPDQCFDAANFGGFAPTSGFPAADMGPYPAYQLPLWLVVK